MTHDNASESSSMTVEPACPPMRLAFIAVASLALGIVTNRMLNASANESFTGEVQVETMVVRAPVDGILQSWHVAEGETVDPDVLLCEIGGHNLARQIQIQEQEVARLEARLAALQAEVDVKVHEHVRELDGDIYQAELQTADLLQKKYYHELEAMAWRDTLESYEESQNLQLTENGVDGPAQSELTDRQINALLKEESATNAVEATEAQLRICNQRLDKLQQQKQTLHERVRLAVGVSEVELHLAQSRDTLKQLTQEQEQQVIRSTRIGTIANFRRRPGEYVQAGEVLADMFQLGESYVRANIPSSQSHQFSVDTTVKCQFPNGETRTGVVTNVAVATSPETSPTRTATGPTVPLRIEPTGALWPQMPVGGHVTIVR
ncbi:HlyD family efflux transporter periplasmic adaptor subunit [bacterium]|nr:hypothetical protein [Planctomyces sp.]MBR9803126.1 HlyD family efflux transporter periplasmic adaptor subunit [bacterium]